MPMDPQLAAIYGTNADESDVEKLAAAELAEKLAEDGEFDPEDLTPEQAEELAQQILAAGDESEEEEAAVEEPAEKTSAAEGSTDDEEAKEKLAEADYLGRVMAHAYVNELKKISSAEAPVEKTAAKGGGRVARMISKLPVKGTARALEAGAVAGAGFGAYKGGKAIYNKIKGKKKKAAADVQEEQKMSALDTLALQRAEEILAAGQEKTSASEQEMQKLQAAVDARAMEMLSEAGYQFEEPKAEETVEEKE